MACSLRYTEDHQGSLRAGHNVIFQAVFAIG